MHDRGPWKVIDSREVYRDPWIAVQIDDVIRPDGKPGTHSIINLKPGVCVIALDGDGHVHLTEEFHYAVGRVTLEGVSGGIDADEDALEAAKRELREELGIVANRWTELGCVDPFTAIVLSPTRLFLAEDLSFGETSHEGTEQIRRVRMSLEDAIAKLLASEITHGPTCVALLRVHLLRSSFSARAGPCER